MNIFCIISLEKEVSFRGYWPVEGFGAVRESWALIPGQGFHCPRPEKGRFCIFPSGESRKMHSRLNSRGLCFPEFWEKALGQKLIDFILAKPWQMDGSPQIPWEWMESTGLLGNLQQDFWWDCFEKWFSLISLTNIICHHSFLPIHITFNQIERQEEKSLGMKLYFSLWQTFVKVCVFLFFWGFPSSFSYFWRVRCSSKNIVGERALAGQWDEKASFPMKQWKKSSPNREYTKDPSQSTPLCSNYKRMPSKCSILIQVKPGFWLLNLFNQVPKTWQNVWKWTSLVWMTTRTLMFMPSQKNLGWLPSLFWKTIPILVKSILLLDLFSLEGHHELSF